MTRGERLHAARKARRLTQQALARMSGLTQPVISELENNHRHLGRKRATRLARALGIDADALRAA